MFSYEFYKVLHFVMILIFVGGMGASFFTLENPKWNKILMGVSSLLIFVAGMGLLARIGVQHGQGFPTWVMLKIALWAFLAVGAPILAKRAQKFRVPVYFAMLTLASLAAWVATNKPFEG